MTEDRGSWMQTYLGYKYWPTHPRQEDVFLGDIAKALANICRFTGHVEPFYSVAQHSVHVSELCDRLGGETLAKAGLLHDAAEAYLGDWARPLKDSLAPECADYLYGLDYKNTVAIFSRFRIANLLPLDKRIHEADDAVLKAEWRDLRGGGNPPIHESGIAPWGSMIKPWTAERAEEEFRTRFIDLFDYRPEWQ